MLPQILQRIQQRRAGSFLSNQMFNAPFCIPLIEKKFFFFGT